MAESADTQYLRSIVEEAASIHDRLTGPFESKGNAESTLAQERLFRWRQKISPSESSNFTKRLTWMNTTVDEVAVILGDVQFNGPLPSWTEVLTKAFARMEVGKKSKFDHHPFGSLITPFAEVGRDLIAPACKGYFSDEAIDELIDDLVKELSHIAAPTFYLKFSVFRTDQHTGTTNSDSTVSYDQFIRGMLSDKLKSTFKEYPVLARLLASVLENWVKNTLDMVNALATDLLALSDQFSDGRELGPVISLQLSLSDKHAGGRTVSILHFKNGPGIVYKPRNIKIEQAWFNFLAELNNIGGEFGLLKVLARDNHGWVQAAQSAPCSSKVDIERYYYRAGMLLCVLYGLEVSDCFFENIIACSDYPMLIDMETLMHPVFRKEADMSPAEEIADDIIFNSVFRAGFLPVWEMGPSGHCVDISGLGAKPGQVTSYVKRHWENVNTDVIELKQKSILVDTADHLPSFNGELASVGEFTDKLVDGFQTMYRIFMAQKKSLTSSKGLLSCLENTEIRLVFHATRIYGLVLKRLGAPRQLRNGVDRSIEMDMISRFYLESRHKERTYKILNAEIQAMEQLDIPKFTIHANSRSLLLPTGLLLENIFEEPAIVRAHNRVEMFSDNDLRLQCEFIRSSLKLSEVIVSHDSSRESINTGKEETITCSPSDLIHEAEEIAAELTTHAIWSADGSATWVAAQLLPGANRHEFRPLRMDLYSGLAGVALFFSALQRVTGQGKDMAMATLQPVRRYLKTIDPERMVRDGYTLGAATGIGSFIACLTWCGEFLEDQALAQEAIDGVAKITPTWIDDDTTLDLMSGSAGAIMGLLCLYERTQNVSALDKAIQCGIHLIQTAEPTLSTPAWSTITDKVYLSGFSHGAAGIAAALYRLARASGQSRFDDFAHQVIASENKLFDTQHQNWSDLRSTDNNAPQFMHTWCHGAPGIGLGRVTAPRKNCVAADKSDIDIAAQTTALYGIGDRDGLCCGALGRSDLFVTKSIIDQDPQTKKLASDWAAQVIQRKRLSGSFRLTGRQGQEFFDPSFFQGLSGIGYQLLRIAHHDKLPSVLAWE